MLPYTPALEPEPTSPDHTFKYRIEFLERLLVVAVTTSGRVDLPGWVRLHQELLQNPFVLGLPILMDHSELDATFLLGDDCRALAQIVNDMDKKLQAPRRAIVLVDGFEFGLMRTSRAQVGADADQRVRAFRSRADALAWLAD
jgi:hypothetical protein